MIEPQPGTVSAPPPAPVVAVTMRDRFGKVYQPAVGPRLKIVLMFIFTGFALLGATGIYLLAVYGLEWIFKHVYENAFSEWILLIHIAVGAIVTLPFLFFGVRHWLSARKRPNRLAVRLGLAVFFAGLVVLITGFALVQLFKFQLPTDSVARWVMKGLHIVAPIAAVVLYIRHRAAGPDIRWRWGWVWGGSVVAFVAAMAYMHVNNPHRWYAVGPRDGEKYYEPSKARTADGKFIDANVLMMDSYCLKCHKDIYDGWFHSAHHFSSFNNPAYLFSVRETREVSLKRDGNTQRSRWCAGCHDPVPFFSGKFDNPDYDDVHDPTSQAGITCTTCHAMTNVNSVVGNGSYTIEEPEHYPFATSDNPVLQWLNNQMVKAKPDLHKKTFLKDFHRSSEFCSTCHKVSLPMEVTDYKEFLRGQNHYDAYLLSGVSGHGARSFYYPAEVKTRCAECHMPLKTSDDFGSRDFDGTGTRKIHDHMFLGGNTGLPRLLELGKYRDDPDEIIKLREMQKREADFLRGTDPDGKDQKVRVDIFALKEGWSTAESKLQVLRPDLPALKPGGKYLIETVVRTLAMGHQLTQGTVDSNEIWVDFQVLDAAGRVIGRSGGMDNRDGPDSGAVDDHAYFINVLMLDRNGNRINRRNPQDIYVPFYDHQIPPGAAAVMHYQLKVPEKSEVIWPLTLKATVRYRKFDYEYMQLVHTTFKLTTESLQQLKVDRVPADQVEKLADLVGKEFDTKQKFLDAVRKLWPAKDAEAHEASLIERATRSGKVPALPIVDLCNDVVTLGPEAVEGGKPSPIKSGWQRWNDYGIGCLLENCWDEPSRCGELEMAEMAFKKVYEIGQKPEADKLVQSHGLLNLVRVYDEIAGKESLAEALKLLEEWRQKYENDPNAPWWTASWLRGRVNFRLGNLDNLNNAIEDLERVLDPANRNPAKHYDFTQDYLVINLLGEVLRKKGEHPQVDSAERVKLFQHAIEVYENALKLDPENVFTHHGLKECFTKFSESMSPADELSDEVTEARLQSRAKAMADTNRGVADRVDDARVLARMLLEYGRREPRRDAPKLPTLQIVHDTVRPLWGHEQSREMSAAVALVLAGVHREMHAVYKVDDNARGRVFPLFREKNPWADAASTVYELHRDGAPGWVRP